MTVWYLEVKKTFLLKISLISMVLALPLKPPPPRGGGGGRGHKVHTFSPFHPYMLYVGWNWFMDSKEETKNVQYFTVDERRAAMDKNK